MKKLTFYAMLIIILFMAAPTEANAPCLESAPDYQGIRSWVYFPQDIDHPLNCAYSGLGCISCTAYPEAE